MAVCGSRAVHVDVACPSAYNVQSLPNVSDRTLVAFKMVSAVLVPVRALS
jgi:hypothetical protein